ncbi:MAG: HD-GYP domain-containing protein [Desulfococcaceae bacterium]|jgi:hypothetical protein|nr:HD-GYP domain-containing protein [Desulfococcaceae bacterium]
MKVDTDKSFTAIHQFSESLGNAIDAKDAYTERHSLEVAEISRILALSLGLETKTADIIHIAGHLHDIGKIGIPDSILHKNGKLTHTEWQAVRRHPQIGAAILRPVSEIADAGICGMVLHHHERYDGQGYPYGLKGEAIPPGARIIAVADSLSAMTGLRPYRPAKTFDEAVREIIRCSGTQFDPEIVRVLSEHRDRIRQTLFSIGGKNMSEKFQIESRISRGNLHLRPKGDFDGISAWELLNCIHGSCDRSGKVFIDTSHLHNLCPFGCNTFRCGLNFSLIPGERIFFKGKKGFDIAPGGCRVLVSSKSKEHRCSGNCANCVCRTGKNSHTLKKEDYRNEAVGYEVYAGQSGRNDHSGKSCR